jgi:hypothetical protein
MNLLYRATVAQPHAGPFESRSASATISREIAALRRETSYCRGDRLSNWFLVFLTGAPRSFSAICLSRAFSIVLAQAREN